MKSYVLFILIFFQMITAKKKQYLICHRPYPSCTTYYSLTVQYTGNRRAFGLLMIWQHPRQYLTHPWKYGLYKWRGQYVIQPIRYLWWLIYAILCLRPERWRHENMSFCRYLNFAFRGEDTKTRQTKGDNTKDFYPPTRNFQQRNFRIFAC